MGRYCGYCMKVFVGRIKACIKDATLSTYEKCLGQDSAMLAKHQALVNVIVQKMVDSGVTDPWENWARVDWEDAEQTAMEHVKRSQLITTTPGFCHMETEEYEAKYGNFETNNMSAKGHKPWTYNGKEGYYVPDPKITKFKFHEVDETVARTTIGTSTEGLSNSDMVSMMKAFMAARRAAALGNDATAVAAGMVLDPAAQVVPPASSPPSAKGQQSGGQQPSPVGGSSPPMPKQPAAGEGPSSSGAGAAPDPHAAPAAGGRRRAAAKKAAAAKPKTEIGSEKIGGEQAAEDATKGSKKRGRPTKSWEPIVQKMVDSFAESTSSGPCYWGAEAKTQLKVIADYTKEVGVRITKATEDSELLSYSKLKKTLGVVSSMVAVVKDHGLESDEFRRVYDLQVGGSLGIQPLSIGRCPLPRDLGSPG